MANAAWSLPPVLWALVCVNDCVFALVVLMQHTVTALAVYAMTTIDKQMQL